MKIAVVLSAVLAVALAVVLTPVAPQPELAWDRSQTDASQPRIIWGEPVATADAGVLCNTTGVCGKIKHWSPDNGLDPAILIRCDWNNPSTNHSLREGETSTKYCGDTDQVYNRPGQKIRCFKWARDGVKSWFDWHTTNGWKKMYDSTNWPGCVVGVR